MAKIGYIIKTKRDRPRNFVRAYIKIGRNSHRAVRVGATIDSHSFRTLRAMSRILRQKYPRHSSGSDEAIKSIHNCRSSASLDERARFAGTQLLIYSLNRYNCGPPIKEAIRWLAE